MKRLQFSLRAMLLVVTLIAACLGLREVVVSKEREARHNNVRILKSILARLEREKASLEVRIQTEDLSTQSDTANLLIGESSIINTTKQMIAQLSD